MSGSPGGASRARVGVAVPAAGSGERMGGVRKAFLELAGEPVLLRALRPFLDEPRVVGVRVALPADQASSPPPWLRELGPLVQVVAGGATRSRSVRAAIAALPEDLDVIAVHDAARPLVTTSLITSCIELALAGFGAVAGFPATDTLKRVDVDGAVLDTPERARHWHAQTPQVFPARALRAAYAYPSAEGTDDASLVERACPEIVVRMVDAGPTNLKVTRPVDVLLAEAVLRHRLGT